MNPFEEIDEFETNFENLTPMKITIRIDKRNARKSITYIENWEIDFDELKKHLKELKTKHGCNGSVKKSDDEIKFQLSGDKRDEVVKYLVNQGISEKDINIIG